MQLFLNCTLISSVFLPVVLSSANLVLCEEIHQTNVDALPRLPSNQTELPTP